MMLTEEEIPEDLIQNSKLFHFGTLSMTHENVRKATKKPLRSQKKVTWSFPLIRIFVLRCGKPWMMPESRYCTVLGNAIF